MNAAIAVSAAMNLSQPIYGMCIVLKKLRAKGRIDDTQYTRWIRQVVKLNTYFSPARLLGRPLSLVRKSVHFPLCVARAVCTLGRAEDSLTDVVASFVAVGGAIAEVIMLPVELVANAALIPASYAGLNTEACVRRIAQADVAMDELGYDVTDDDSQNFDAFSVYFQKRFTEYVAKEKSVPSVKKLEAFVGRTSRSYVNLSENEKRDLGMQALFSKTAQ